MDPTNATITLTFGDQAENHVGMEQLGQKVAPGMGFNLQDFQDIEKTFMAMDVTCLLHDLGDGAYLLVLKQAVDALLKSSGKTKEDLWEEQCALQVDKKALMYGRVVDKHARWNLCFDDHSQEPDIENGKGRVIALSATPVTSAIVSQFESVFGPKAQNLKGEGNYYYDITKCGIGYHGDAERRKVLAVRLGASNPIHFQWFQDGKPIRDHMVFELEGGDMYIMSEKTVGTDFKKRKIPTLRHAVGAEKYVKL